MILTIAFLLISFFLGYKVSCFFLGNKTSKIALWMISYIFGLTLSCFSILILAVLLKNLQYAVFSFLAVSFVVSLFLIRWQSIKNLPALVKKINFSEIPGKIKKLPWIEIIFLLLFCLLFLDLVSKTLVFDGSSYKVALAGYGDIPFHMAEVSYFIHSQPFGLQEPIYSGQKLSYPFLINFLSAVFYIQNKNYIFSFHFPAITLALSGILLLYLLFRKIIKKTFARICAFLIFFLGSGTGYLKIAEDRNFFAQKGIANILNYLLHLPYPITVFYNARYPEQNNIWSSILTMFLMHQRSFFFGIALGAVCIFLAYLAFETKEKKVFIFAGIALGLMPLAHIHSFVAISIIVFSFFLAAVIFRKRDIAYGFLKTIVFTTLFSLPSLAYIFCTQFLNNNKGFLAFRLGWMSKPGIGSINYNPAFHIHITEYLSYMWENFGFILPLLLLAIVIFLVRRENNRNILMYSLIISAVLLWGLLNIIKFQPWDFDNNKFFAYFLLPSALVIGCFFERMYFKGAKLIVVFLTFFIVLSGAIDAFNRSSLANPPLYGIFGQDDLKTADFIINYLPHGKNILTGSTFLNLVDSLAGRPVLLGYEGWLWTHGIDYQSRGDDVQKMFSGTQFPELAKKYNIGYVLIGPPGQNNQKANMDYFASNYKIIFQSKEYKIYKIPD